MNETNEQTIRVGLTPEQLAKQEADFQAAFEQDVDDIKRDIAKHGVAY